VRAEGTGGRNAAGLDDERLLDGVQSDSEIPAGQRTRQCRNRACRRWFISRQSGDDYCSGQCDLDDERGSDDNVLPKRSYAREA
jgi:hypothetical protein